MNPSAATQLISLNYGAYQTKKILCIFNEDELKKEGKAKIN